VKPPFPIVFPLAPSYSPTTPSEVPHLAFVHHGGASLLLRLYVLGPNAGRNPSKHQKLFFFPPFCLHSASGAVMLDNMAQRAQPSVLNEGKCNRFLLFALLTRRDSTAGG